MARQIIVPPNIASLIRDAKKSGKTLSSVLVVTDDVKEQNLIAAAWLHGFETAVKKYEVKILHFGKLFYDKRDGIYFLADEDMQTDQEITWQFTEEQINSLHPALMNFAEYTGGWK